ncbi:SDR family NAD(P)-dependent oxidoreductase [Novosphingobium malaysiense]|uniref:Ketoreductase domain-containing protein n=1 Tax=Novosphingobium malaysiense TaxID=1348853 RepID=A0A0B1ZFB8_9SPHN|nr:SDR family oxidoreductase [Novosphingobium malaysiense]KHK89185.1 hypothetical protein LK12_21945 [Novosphingobium malaysiense]
MNSLAEKIVLVVGASKGTGRQIALAAARAGADVALAARSGEAVRNVAAEIEALGRRALPMTADVSVTDDCRRMVSDTVDHFGRLDSIIYNAAWEHPRPLFKIDEAHWDRMLDTNLKGFFFTAQAAAKAMIDGGQVGAIVAIASSAGTVGFPLNADYCASKGGMVALVKAMAIDLAGKNVRVNALAPGFINGEAVAAADQGDGAKVLAALRNFLPHKRFAEQEEVAHAALFLASDASSYFNGSIVAADGGLTLGNLPQAG